MPEEQLRLHTGKMLQRWTAPVRKRPLETFVLPKDISSREVFKRKQGKYMQATIRRNVEQITDTLGTCLEQYFQDISPEKHAIQVWVECGGPEEYEDGQRRERTLHFHRPDGAQIDGRLMVVSKGGNVYHITVWVADHEAKTFNVSPPDASMPPQELQPYVEELCEHLLAEVERETGEQFLRDVTAQSGGE